MGKRVRRRMSSLKKKDYYQFCYDENEIVSSNENSFEEVDSDEEDVFTGSRKENETDGTRTELSSKGHGRGQEAGAATQYPDSNIETPDHICGSRDEEVLDDFIDDIFTFDDEDCAITGNQGNGPQYTPRNRLTFEQMEFLDDDEHTETDFVKNNDIVSNNDDSDVFSSTSTVDQIVGSPSSVESFQLDGYVIEIDEESNTININTSPIPENLNSGAKNGSVFAYKETNSEPLFEGLNPNRSTNGVLFSYLPPSGLDEYEDGDLSHFLSVPSPRQDDELSSSGVSLDSSGNSPASSAPSLNTEIDRLRNFEQSLICDLNTPAFERSRFRRISGASTNSGSLLGKSAKSLESLKSRSSTPDHRSKSSKKLKETTSSMFRLKRSSSMSLSKQKHRLSKNRDSMTDPSIWNSASSSELTLQQPSPFVRTIFQFIETEDDEMFPSSSHEDLTMIPIFSMRHKLFTDIGKTNSLSRRHKHKNNLSSIVRQIQQDSHEPVLLSTGRRVCETAEFLIAVISYLDRIRKAKEIVEETGMSRLPQQPHSNRFERLSLRKSYLMPLTLHERFSKKYDNTVFNEDLILTELASRKGSKRNSTNEDSLLNRSKSLRNLSFGSLRRKAKPKHQDSKREEDLSTNSSTANNQNHINSTKDNILRNHINDHEKTHLSCYFDSKVEGGEEALVVDIEHGVEKNQAVLNDNKMTKMVQSAKDGGMKKQENNGDLNQSNSSAKQSSKQQKKLLEDDNVCKNCSNALSVAEQQQLNSELTEKSSQSTIRYLAGKFKKINKRSKIPDVEYWTEQAPQENVERTQQQSPDVDKLRQQFEIVKGDMEENKDLLQVVEDVKVERKEDGGKKKSSGLRRSLSWRLRKDKGKNELNDDQSPKIKEKTEKPNKFSSIRSMFEPLSPSEKKKFSVQQGDQQKTPIRRRSTNSKGPHNRSKTDSVVSLRYSKIDDDGVHLSPNTANSPLSTPSSPEMLNSSGGLSSEVYSSSDSSPVSPPDGRKKSFMTRITQDTQVESRQQSSERIIVDVPLHLIPPEIAVRSPKSSPKTSRRIIAAKARPQSPASPLSSSPETRTRLSTFAHKKTSITIPSIENHNQHTSTKKLSESPLSSPETRTRLSTVIRRPTASSSTQNEEPKFVTAKEINNNLFDRMDNRKRQENEDTAHAPVIKPTPIRPSTIGVVKPKQNGSNVAMVSPIMKSDMVQTMASTSPLTTPSTTDNIHENSSSLRISPTSKSVRRRQTIDNVERPGNHLYSSGNTRQIEVFLLLDQDQKTKDAFKIETINIDRSISYRDIENSIIEGFNKHLQLLDQQKLDINREDIAYLQMAQHKISIGSPFDLSQVNIENGYLPCQMFLKGNNEWSLASMAYDTLIPKTYLEKYVSLILTHRQVVFYGPSGTGKSYIARRIATIISHRMNNNTIPMLTYKNMTPEQWKDLLKDLKNNKRNQPYVILVDGFASNFIKQGKDLTEIISTSESIHPQPYVICTLTQSPNYEIPSTWQNNFKWIWLPNHEEPINGVLQRFLRRRYTQHGHKDTYQEVFRVADWLAETWRYINTILEKFNSAECTIGPTMFYTCPIDINAAEEWFIDLWNYSITPYFLHAIKCGIKLYGQRHQWIDPLDWILKSYPWKPNTTPGKVDKKTKLRRIRPEDVGFQTSCNNTQPQVDSESEKQRLLDFLRQLEILMRDGGLGELPNFEQSSQYESSI
ncbi:uncharacterized protein [Clytia hemisphaerica]|uniref:uncharacterized protein isoform X2 n=1 Tax=Clytia hemisphaerica TaxID=252671 RepID=UPI0034D4CF39